MQFDDNLQLYHFAPFGVGTAAPLPASRMWRVVCLNVNLHSGNFLDGKKIKQNSEPAAELNLVLVNSADLRKKFFERDLFSKTTWQLLLEGNFSTESEILAHRN